MVIHEMGLFAEGFGMIKEGSKKIEIRLYDSKRQKIKTGDEIIFGLLPDKNETIKVQVTGVDVYKDFETLYRHVDFAQLGRAGKTPEWMLQASYDYYTKQDEATYGVVAISFIVIP